MTFNDIIDEIRSMCKPHIEKAKDATIQHNQKVRRNKAISLVESLAPKGPPTTEELREYRRSCLCAHDRDNPPMYWPRLEREVDQDSIRSIAIGMFNLALKVR